MLFSLLLSLGVGGYWCSNLLAFTALYESHRMDEVEAEDGKWRS